LEPIHFEPLGTRTRRRAIVFTLALMVLLAVSLWIYSGVRAALYDLAAANLRSLLDVQVVALDTWIGEKQLNVRRWAADPRVHDVAVALQALDAKAGTPDAGTPACRSPLRAQLVELIDGMRQGEAAPAIRLVDRRGRVLAARDGASCGGTLSPDKLAAMASVWAGESVFIPPLADNDVPAGARQAGRALVWLSAPVRDESGQVVAALNVGKFADERFARLFSAARVGDTGEGYAFDERGRLLSESRYGGSFDRGTGDEVDPLGLGLRLADPNASETDPALTRLIGLALQAHSTPGGLRGGEVLEPYTSYAGAQVVGAWRWLDRHDFGVAVEIAESEALAPARRLQQAFTVLAVLVGMGVLGLVVALLGLAGMRAEVAAARRVGNYELFDEIGQGGVARVYRARHRLLKRPTAVKIIELHQSTDELLARFDREVKLCSQLMHPNTIEIYDYGRTPEGRPFYAMELLEGLTLQQLVDRHGAFNAARTLRVLVGIAGSLSEAHERGLVHRDVTPGNVMLCRKGADFDFPKLLDFGLIKDTRGPHTRDLTRALRILGTPSYMAPERIERPDSADTRSDLYALGAVAFFMMTGRAPFVAEGDLALAYQVVNAPVPDVTAFAQEPVPAVLAALIARCLEKDPDRRPQNSTELVTLLDALSAQHPWTTGDARAWWEAHDARAGSPVHAAGEHLPRAA
jgi:serine/threonine-protein kinase